MTTLNSMQFQDCQAIVKMFKKGCHASMTTGATVAPLTGGLNFTKNMSGTIVGQMEAWDESSWKSKDGESETVSLGTAIKDTAASMFSNIGDNFVPGGDFTQIFNSDCIPCGISPKFWDELSLGVELEFPDLLEIMQAWLDRQLSQIKDIINMFKNLDQYVDICSFFNFFKDFMCLPDLYRILAILTALMMDLSFELNAIIDLAIGLIVPLFMPFLTNIMDTLIKFIMLIVKPIECIIDSIQNMLSKLDYNVLFQNIDRLKVGFGPKKGAPNRPEAVGQKTEDNLNNLTKHFGFDAKIKLPYVGALSTQDPAFNGEDYRPRHTEFNLTPNPIKDKVAKEEERIRRAEKVLEKIRKTSSSVEGSDPEAISKYKEQEKKAVNEYRDAVRGRDMSAIGRANQNIEKFQKNIKGAFLELVTFLREACLKIDSLFTGLFDEFKKLLGEFVGGTGLYIDFSAKKLAILQMIGFMTAIINALKNGVDCDEDKAIDSFLSNLPPDRNFKIWTDDDGNISIEENLDELNDAIDGMAQNFDEEVSPSKKLASLIEYTGDATLDAEISETIETLVQPKKLVLGCQMITTVEDAEKVNSWIEELGG